MGIRVGQTKCMVRIQSDKPCGMKANYQAIFICKCLLAETAPPVIIDTPLYACDACRKLRMKNVMAMLGTDENLQVIMSQLEDMKVPEPETIRIGFKMTKEGQRELIEEGNKAPDQGSFLRLVTGGKPVPPCVG